MHQQRGTLRYCGPTLFASGIWAGVELDEGVGKNNGSINNIYYFKCPPGYGNDVVFMLFDFVHTCLTIAVRKMFKTVIMIFFLPRAP